MRVLLALLVVTAQANDLSAWEQMEEEALARAGKDLPKTLIRVGKPLMDSSLVEDAASLNEVVMGRQECRACMAEHFENHVNEFDLSPTQQAQDVCGYCALYAFGGILTGTNMKPGKAMWHTLPKDKVSMLQSSPRTLSAAPPRNAFFKQAVEAVFASTGEDEDTYNQAESLKKLDQAKVHKLACKGHDEHGECNEVLAYVSHAGAKFHSVIAMRETIKHQGLKLRQAPTWVDNIDTSKLPPMPEGFGSPDPKNSFQMPTAVKMPSIADFESQIAGLTHGSKEGKDGNASPMGKSTKRPCKKSSMLETPGPKHGNKHHHGKQAPGYGDKHAKDKGLVDKHGKKLHGKKLKEAKERQEQEDCDNQDDVMDAINAYYDMTTPTAEEKKAASKKKAKDDDDAAAKKLIGDIVSSRDGKGKPNQLFHDLEDLEEVGNVATIDAAETYNHDDEEDKKRRKDEVTAINRIKEIVTAKITEDADADLDEEQSSHKFDDPAAVAAAAKEAAKDAPKPAAAPVLSKKHQAEADEKKKKEEEKKKKETDARMKKVVNRVEAIIGDMFSEEKNEDRARDSVTDKELDKTYSKAINQAGLLQQKEKVQVVFIETDPSKMKKLGASLLETEKTMPWAGKGVSLVKLPSWLDAVMREQGAKLNVAEQNKELKGNLAKMDQKMAEMKKEEAELEHQRKELEWSKLGEQEKAERIVEAQAAQEQSVEDEYGLTLPNDVKRATHNPLKLRQKVDSKASQAAMLGAKAAAATQILADASEAINSATANQKSQVMTEETQKLRKLRQTEESNARVAEARGDLHAKDAALRNAGEYQKAERAIANQQTAEEVARIEDELEKLVGFENRVRVPAELQESTSKVEAQRVENRVDNLKQVWQEQENAQPKSSILKLRQLGDAKGPSKKGKKNARQMQEGAEKSGEKSDREQRDEAKAEDVSAIKFQIECRARAKAEVAAKEKEGYIVEADDKQEITLKYCGDPVIAAIDIIQPILNAAKKKPPPKNEDGTTENGGDKIAKALSGIVDGLNGRKEEDDAEAKEEDAKDDKVLTKEQKKVKREAKKVADLKKKADDKKKKDQADEMQKTIQGAVAKLVPEQNTMNSRIEDYDTMRDWENQVEGMKKEVKLSLDEQKVAKAKENHEALVAKKKELARAKKDLDKQLTEEEAVAEKLTANMKMRPGTRASKNSPLADMGKMNSAGFGEEPKKGPLSVEDAKEKVNSIKEGTFMGRGSCSQATIEENGEDVWTRRGGFQRWIQKAKKDAPDCYECFRLHASGEIQMIGSASDSDWKNPLVILSHCSEKGEFANLNINFVASLNLEAREKAVENAGWTIAKHATVKYIEAQCIGEYHCLEVAGTPTSEEDQEAADKRACGEDHKSIGHEDVREFIPRPGVADSSLSKVATGEVAEDATAEDKRWVQKSYMYRQCTAQGENSNVDQVYKEKKALDEAQARKDRIEAGKAQHEADQEAYDASRAPEGANQQDSNDRRYNGE